MRAPLLAISCTFAALSLAVAQEPPPPAAPPGAAELAAAAQRTLKRLQEEAVSWTALFQLKGGVLRVRGLSSPTLRAARYRLAAASGQGAGQELLDVLMTGDRWYVREAGGLRGQYRPYEAPFTLPTALMFLFGAELRVVDVRALGVPLGFQEGVLTVTLPLPPRLAAALAEADRELKASGKQPPAELVQALREAPRIDVQAHTGLIVGGPVARGQLHVTDLVWSPEGVAAELAPPADLPDHAAPPDLSRPEDLVVVAHAGAWQPGQPAGDTDACLLDLKTGAHRRVPYAGALSLPGCFLPGRKAVLVLGAGQGGMHLVKVDLESGQNTPLGGAALQGGISLMPALSPDGKRVALLHRAASQGGLASRLHLLDLETDQVQAVGQPLDGAFLSWWPDGESILLLRRIHPQQQGAAPLEQVARLHLEDGRVEGLFPGRTPALIRRGQALRILFLAEDGAWKHCAEDGSDPQPLGDGQPRCSLPSPAPDGRRLLMLEARPPGAPGLVVVDVETGSRTPVEHPALQRGLWTIPAWR